VAGESSEAGTGVPHGYDLALRGGIVIEPYYATAAGRLTRAVSSRHLQREGTR